MTKLQTPESTIANLINAVLNSHHKHGLSAVDWFVKMLDDCLAGFGKKLEKGWEEEEKKHLFEIGGLYAQAVMKNPYVDVLGKLYQELASGYGKKLLGQYFTPFSVASCISQIQYDPKLYERKSIVRVQEPAAGSGVMILALMKTIVEDDLSNLAKTSFVCIDLDAICVKMTTLQILANCMIHQVQLGEIITLRGNTLGPAHELETFYHASSPEFMELEKAEVELKDTSKKLSTILEKISNSPEVKEEPESGPIVIEPKKQLSVFDFLS